jgi:hypothetical protein
MGVRNVHICIFPSSTEAITISLRGVNASLSIVINMLILILKWIKWGKNTVNEFTELFFSDVLNHTHRLMKVFSELFVFNLN